LKKIIVYTAIFGAYDSQLVDVEYDQEKFDFVCFTNQKRLKSKCWDIRLVEDPIPNDNPRSSYYFKTNPHKLWGDQYEMSIWIDSSCNKLDTDKLYKMAENFNDLTRANLLIEKHPGRNCIYKELEANIHFKKDDEQAMRAHVETYRKEGMPTEFGMVETGLQLRKHNAPEVIEFQDMLWNEMITKTRRDQLSWTYCAWKLNFKYDTFTFQEKTEILWFQDHPHKSIHTEKVLLVGPWYGEEMYEQQWADYVTEFVGMKPFDTVIVGCRPGREGIYVGIQPDRFITEDPKGEKKLNLLNGSLPRFSVKSTGEKEITQINPKDEIFNRFKLYDGSVHFKIHMVGWKAGRYIERALKSLLNQKHQNWEAQIVLDPDETNETYRLAKKYECDKIKVHLNKDRHGPTMNHMECVAMMKPDDNDVCVTLDADDWFAHDYALTVIENEYLSNPKTLITHGSWIDYPNPGSLQPNNSHPYSRTEFDNIRKTIFKASHVRTVKYKIWKEITSDYLIHSQTGKYYDSCGDVAIMLTALEMAGYDRVKFIPDILYVYNRETDNNEDKVSKSQQFNMRDIMNKKPHALYTDGDGIDGIVFSKDRACQLDAFLRSMKEHHKNLDDCSTTILYTYSNDEFKKGYELLIKRYPEFSFVKETNFKEDLKNIYAKGVYDYIQFFVDDNVWKNDFSFDNAEYKMFKMDDYILTLSLRLHPEITYCQPMNKVVTQPSNLDECDNVWEWKNADGDWGYPMSVDGNIFRKKNIDRYVNMFMYNNPNTFEAVMSTNPPSIHTKMLCYSDSKILNIPMNRVQTTFQNPCGDVDIKMLNDKLLSGEVININKVNGFKNSACHQEIGLEFNKYGGSNMGFEFTPFDKKVKDLYGKSLKGVLHIGAHFGQEYEIYKNMGVENLLFFEPIPQTFDVLKKNVPEKWLVNKGAGNFNGTTEMYVENKNQGQSSSILKPKKHLELYPNITFHGKQKISVVKLDDFIENKDMYNAMNIDTQGYELEVLKGASELLHSIDVINLEINRDELYEGCPHYTEIDNFLKPYGFKRLLTEWWLNSSSWGDALYVKKHDIKKKLSLAISIHYTPQFDRLNTIETTINNIVNDDRIDEIVICDDNSDELFVKSIKDRFVHDKIKIYRSDKKQYAKGNKLETVSHCKNDWVILLDSDNIIDTDYIDVLYDIDDWKSNVFYTPSVLNSEGKFGNHVWDFTKFDIIDKTTAMSEVGKSGFDVIMNAGNYLVNRNEYMKLKTFSPISVDGVEVVDVMLVNANWILMGNKLKSVPNLQYRHSVHDGSFYLNNQYECVKQNKDILSTFIRILKEGK